MNNKQATKTKSRMAIIILFAIAVLDIGVIWIISIWYPDPKDVLKRDINSYQYFLEGNEISKYTHAYENDTIIRINTTIAKEKIPELLQTRILNACNEEDYYCHEPLWRIPIKFEFAQYSAATLEDKKEDDEFLSSEDVVCTSAESSRRGTTSACVNTETGVFAFYELIRGR